MTSELPEIRRYSTAAEFMAACSAFLCEREAENNLLLGIGGAVGTSGSPYSTFYLASAGPSPIEGSFMMTPPHNLQLSAPVSDAAMHAVMDDLAVRGFQVPGVNGVAESSDRFIEIWCRRNGGRAEPTHGLYCYKLSEVRSVPRAPGGYRKARNEDFEMLVEWSHAFDRDADLDEKDDSQVRKALRIGLDSGHYFIWEDDQPVAMARTSGATPTGIRVSSVYTPRRLRGRGYATSLVADLSARELMLGRKFCFLFTDATNPTSNKIYQRIGYEQVCEFHQYSFVND